MEYPERITVLESACQATPTDGAKLLYRVFQKGFPLLAPPGTSCVDEERFASRLLYVKPELGWNSGPYGVTSPSSFAGTSIRLLTMSGEGTISQRKPAAKVRLGRTLPWSWRGDV